jgi:hypothetical protein
MSVADSDTIEYGREPRTALRYVALAVAAAAVLASLGSMVVSHHRAAEQRQARVSYDRLLTLAAAGQASVERAISQTRDVTQYAEPLLNSSLTAPAERDTLFRQVTTAQAKSRSDIDVERELLASTPASGRLRPARDATLAYLSGWSAMFAPAGAGGSATSQDDLVARQRAALAALQRAAPDPARAAEADTVLGDVDG